MPKPNNNGVVITVYVESPSTNIRPLSESNPSNKVKRNPFSKKCKRRSQGYDRRAELLAYTQKLRASDNNEEIQWNDEESSKHKSKMKQKWKCPTTPRKLGISFLGILRKTKGRWKYQRVPSDQTEEDYKRNSNGKRKKPRRRKFWRKLKWMLRGLSYFWRRKKG